MADDQENGERTGDEESQDENQYGGGDQDIDAVEQTERMEEEAAEEDDGDES